MESSITKEDLEKIEAGIRGKYVQVAQSPEGQFNYPTGINGLTTLQYDQDLIDRLPASVAASYCGVGNPFSLGTINSDERVLDIGCGAGVDTILAAMMAGPSGKAVGVDIIPEMLRRAGDNLAATGLENVEFQKASGESLPFPDDSFDVVISNGVINLIPDKESALAEIFRVLRPEGRLMVADQVATVEIRKDLKDRLDGWFRWEGGTIPGMDFLAMLRKVGFQHVELVKETGLNSTPKTKGVLVKALKPRTVTLKLQPMDFMESNTEKAAPFMDIAPDMPKKRRFGNRG